MILYQDDETTVSLEPVGQNRCLALRVEAGCGRFYLQGASKTWYSSPPGMSVSLRVSPERVLSLLTGAPALEEAPGPALTFQFRAHAAAPHPFVGEEGGVCLGPSIYTLEAVITDQEVTRESALLLIALRRGHSSRTHQPFRQLDESGWRQVSEAEAQASGLPMYP